MKQDIGINQRIPMNVLELAMLAELQGNASTDYFRELAATEYNGQNRIGKAVQVINRLTKRNPLLPYLKENQASIESMMRSKTDKPLLMTAIISSAYGFGYDVVALLGKHFHAQESVTSVLIRDKMAAKYGSNRSLPNALYCILPMLIEAGLLERPKVGVYKAIRISKASDEAKKVYCESFLLNNPNLNKNDDFKSNPYFEFVK